MALQFSPVTPAPTTVGEVFNATNTRLNDVLANADTFIEQLRDLTTTGSDLGRIENVLPIQLPQVDYLQLNAPGQALDFLTSRAVTRPSITVPTVTVPLSPAFDFTAVDDIVVPDFDGVRPAVNLPATPSTALPTAPTAPSISDPVLPTAPTVTLPTAPVFGSVTLPLPPGVDIPAFLSGLPSEDFLTPSNTFEFYEQAYASALLDEIQSKLLDDLQNGGYGIETADEQDLFQRARDREYEAALADIDEVYRAGAARGFPLPPGELFISEQRAQQALSNKLSSVSREITLERSRLYVENRRFAIEQSKGLEQILIGFHNSVQERALNFAKATLDAAIAVYEAQLKRYNARLDAYKTEAQVFEARIRAALAQVEIYRTQMDGARLELESQKAQADIYRTQLLGIETVVGIYRTQVEAAGVQAQVERTRLESFRALIDAYQSQVQAKVAEFGLYEAQIRGETAKVQLYEADARAYSSRVDGLRARSEVMLGRLRGETDQARATIDAYRGQLTGVELQLKSQVEAAQQLVSLYGADTQAMNAAVAALAEALRLDLRRQEDNADLIYKSADVKFKTADTVLKGLQLLVETKLKATSVGSEYFKTLAAALANGVQSLATSSATASS